MSDDLISRQAVLKLLYEIKGDSCIPKNYGTILDIIRNARNIPTAFDKEKVIEELQKHSHNYYPSIDHYCLSRKAVDLTDAIEIIEKGGIE